MTWTSGVIASILTQSMCVWWGRGLHFITMPFSNSFSHNDKSCETGLTLLSFRSHLNPAAGLPQDSYVHNWMEFCFEMFLRLWIHTQTLLLLAALLLSIHLAVAMGVWAHSRGLFMVGGVGGVVTVVHCYSYRPCIVWHNGLLVDSLTKLSGMKSVLWLPGWQCNRGLEKNKKAWDFPA